LVQQQVGKMLLQEQVCKKVGSRVSMAKCTKHDTKIY